MTGPTDAWAAIDAGTASKAPHQRRRMICCVAYGARAGTATDGDAFVRYWAARRRGVRWARTLPRSIETVVIGAGQAGLLMSWHLQQAGREHVVLDRRETLGGGWQDRWDGFPLVGPNWTTEHAGVTRTTDDDPDGFMTRDEVAGRMRRYAEVIGAPVHRSTEVSRLSRDGAGGRRFRLETSRGPDRHRRRDRGDRCLPQAEESRLGAAGFSPRITQLHAHDYRNVGQLPPGGVLIVGSGQTGAQLAEELPDGRARRLAVGGPLRAGAATISRPRLLLVDPAARAPVVPSSGRRCRRSISCPSRAAPVRVQPAPLRARRRPRHQPAADGDGRRPAGWAVRRGRWRASHVRGGPRRQPAPSPTAGSTTGCGSSWTRSPSGPAST